MQHDTLPARILRADDHCFYLFQAMQTKAPGSECDACGETSTRGFHTLRIEEDMGKVHNTGAWSCCLSCAVTNAEADYA